MNKHKTLPDDSINLAAASTAVPCCVAALLPLAIAPLGLPLDQTGLACLPPDGWVHQAWTSFRSSETNHGERKAKRRGREREIEETRMGDSFTSPLAVQPELG